MAKTAQYTDDQFLQKPMPNSADAERVLIASVIHDPELMTDLIGNVRNGDIYNSNFRKIYAAMETLYSHGTVINQLTIAEELKRNGQLEHLGGYTFISNLTHGIPYGMNLTKTIQIIKDKTLLRDLIKVNSLGTAEALDEEDDAKTIVQRSEERIFALSQSSNTVDSNFVNLVDIIPERIELAREVQKTGKAITGVPSGFKDLDSLTCGDQRGHLVITAARPRMGKTALALNKAMNASLTDEMTIAFFSLEMSKQALTDRAICSEARVDSHAYRQGFVKKEEWERIKEVEKRLSKSHVFILDTPNLTVLEAKSKLRRLVKSIGKVDKIIVDYLQRMVGSKKFYSGRYEEVSEISRDLKAMAMEFNVPVEALSQLSRAPDQRENHRPMLSDLRESGGIEQDADVVQFIYREALYKDTEEEETDELEVAELIIAKQREGPEGIVKLLFTPQFTRFDNLTKMNGGDF